MKGIILAGGKGSRLAPLTEVTNKHLLPVGSEPMLWHPVRQLVMSDIQDILVITSTTHMGDIVSCLGSGNRFQCDFTYKVQEEALGIAHALSLAEDFAAGEKIVVLLGDNIFEHAIYPHVQEFSKQSQGAKVLLKEVTDPQRYGVAALDEKQIIEIEEKPTQPKSKFAVVGCYMYDDQAFNFIKQIKLSVRGEYEITSLNNLYIQHSQLQYGFVKGRWTDAGTFISLNEANQILSEINNQISQ